MRNLWLLLILLVLALRLSLAFSTPNYDGDSYALVADVWQRGGNVYAETERYNYSPVWFHVVGWLGMLPGHVVIAVRVMLTLVDLANALLVLYMTGSYAHAVLYFANPVMVVISSWGGQFEALAITPILWWLAMPTKRDIWLFVACALAVIVKQHIAVIVYALLVYEIGWKRALLWCVGIASLFVLTFAPYLQTGIDGILHNVILYDSVFLYGLVRVMPLWAVRTLFVVALVALPVMLRRRVAQRRFLALQSLAMMTFIWQVGFQYFYIPAALTSLVWDRRWSYGVLAFAIAGVGLVYFGVYP